jgi:hypothetical protein
VEVAAQLKQAQPLVRVESVAQDLQLSQLIFNNERIWETL